MTKMITNPIVYVNHKFRLPPVVTAKTLFSSKLMKMNGYTFITEIYPQGGFPTTLVKKDLSVPYEPKLKKSRDVEHIETMSEIIN